MKSALTRVVSLAGVSLCAALFGGVAGIGGIAPAGHEFAKMHHNLQTASDPVGTISKLADVSGMKVISAQA